MAFIHKDFMLGTKTAQTLYHEHAEKLPIIDYHCHLIPKMIADDYKFADITELWLGGDHYKWRAMRGNGVPEEFITGGRTPKEKFLALARIMPLAVGNPVYEWLHLDLRRCFGIDDLLCEKNCSLT